ncbi:hypothetical protein GCM10020295_71420 [Streptomyces cinereospinus]
MAATHSGAAHGAGPHSGAAHPHSPDAVDAVHAAGVGHVMDGSTSFGMAAAHLLAALLCGLWLAHGERAAFRILRAVAGWLAAPLRLPLVMAAPPPRPRPPSAAPPVGAGTATSSPRPRDHLSGPAPGGPLSDDSR